ncbi:hypothetical protein LINPERHAP1_LOCUS25057, partial [Linum perenne]
MSQAATRSSSICASYLQSFNRRNRLIVRQLRFRVSLAVNWESVFSDLT